MVWVSDDNWESFLDAAGSHGIQPRISDALGFARRSRVLLLRHTSSGIDLDVSLGALPFEKELIERASRHDLAGVSVPLPAPDDLVVMKAVAHRPRDLADIEGLLQANPSLDRARALRLVREFADLLEAPELARDLESVFSRVPARG